VPVSVFDGFDYAALGHIHKPQRMGGRVRYSGSPMAYSFGAEEAHEKGFVLFDTENGEQRFLPVRQLHPHRTVSASCEEILSRQKELENCWLNLSVTDRPAGPELYSEMRERFPYLAFLRGRSAGTGEMTGAITGEELMKMSDIDILKQFLADTESPVTPTEGQLAWFEKTMLAEEEESLQ
jgi:exonuclease SbcD